MKIVFSSFLSVPWFYPILQEHKALQYIKNTLYEGFFF